MSLFILIVSLYGSALIHAVTHDGDAEPKACQVVDEVGE